MRLAQNPSGKWVVYYNGSPIAISGQTQFETREEAVEQIATRGLYVTDEGEIKRSLEPVFKAAEPVEAKPEAPAPVVPAPEIFFHSPAEGGASPQATHGFLAAEGTFSTDEETISIESFPDDPIGTALTDGFKDMSLDVVITDVNPEALELLAGKKIVLEMDPDVTEADIEPIPLDVSGVPAAVEKLTETIKAAAKAEQDKIPEAEEPKGKRGRPRTYTPEEAAERRREQNRKYYHARKEARKAEVAERSKEWWETHPEKVNEYRTKANEKRRSRYSDDPEYRAKVAAYNRDYQARKRAERQAAREAAKAAQDTPTSD